MKDCVNPFNTESSTKLYNDGPKSFTRRNRKKHPNPNLSQYLSSIVFGVDNLKMDVTIPQDKSTASQSSSSNIPIFSSTTAQNTSNIGSSNDQVNSSGNNNTKIQNEIRLPPSPPLNDLNQSRNDREFNFDTNTKVQLNLEIFNLSSSTTSNSSSNYNKDNNKIKARKFNYRKALKPPITITNTSLNSIPSASESSSIPSTETINLQSHVVNTPTFTAIPFLDGVKELGSNIFQQIPVPPLVFPLPSQDSVKLDGKDVLQTNTKYLFPTPQSTYHMDVANTPFLFNKSSIDIASPTIPTTLFPTASNDPSSKKPNETSIETNPASQNISNSSNIFFFNKNQIDLNKQISDEKVLSSPFKPSFFQAAAQFSAGVTASSKSITNRRRRVLLRTRLPTMKTRLSINQSGGSKIVKDDRDDETEDDSDYEEEEKKTKKDDQQTSARSSKATNSALSSSKSLDNLDSNHERNGKSPISLALSFWNKAKNHYSCKQYDE